ncbi:MurR/RpiR family transcriptional regulator [Bacillus sp. AFS017336]|uniref:MurR/RpiR family transcriptional regulator n=1 Tax=Bacillus sp. AFS017336 TaxID=2033489 RepID=UPI000BEF66CC|nr:MurR/RpiR family transcriptional regulator [Bacillus sp. AFS017336]PEL10497.1 RpiR-family transcriptional regulator [Bacillus sp. AFS017336]
MKRPSFKLLVKEKFSQLSPGQKKVATYMIENLEECAFKAAYQIGRKADVSETTVIRLSYALEFEGFSDMQLSVQNEFLHLNKADYMKEKEEIKDISGHHTYTKIIENEVNILRNLLQPSNIEEISKAVEAIISSDQVLIVGHRVSHIAAYWFANTLSSIRGNVMYCSPAGDFFEKFCNLTDKSVVIAFSFPRYAKETLTIAECTKENGVKLISVTDRLLSPIGRIADIILTTEENVESGSNSVASVISLLNLVIAGLYEKDKKRIQMYQQKLEKIYSTYEVFIE